MTFKYLFAIAFLFFISCTKNQDEAIALNHTEVIVGISEVISATYKDLDNKASSLKISVDFFNTNATEENLTAARLSWKQMRLAWEQSESFLYGPVSTEDIDPNIDTWPIAKDKLRNEKLTEIEPQLNDTYLDNAGEDIRGFHGLELLLFGLDGNIKAADISAVQKKYMGLLVNNLKALSEKLLSEWKNYKAFFNAPSATNIYYKTNKEIYLTVIDGLIDICEEVAEGKMNEIFTNQTPQLEESPFANNSIKDFTDNLQSVANIYLGTYGSVNNGGLSVVIKYYSTVMDQEIKTQIQNSISALNKITDPFGTAIKTQSHQVQNAISALTTLKNVLEIKAKVLINEKIK